MSAVSSENFKPQVPRQTERLSILHGPVDPPLVDFTLGELLQLQTIQYGARECLVIPWTGARWTYNELNQQSTWLAQSLLGLGIGAGDRVGVMAGNCEQYAAVFFAVAKLGAILVILNNSYTWTEAMYGIRFSGCKLVFTTRTIGRNDNSRLLNALDSLDQRLDVVILHGEPGHHITYAELVKGGSRKCHDRLYEVMRRVSPYQVVNLQFTSGTTGLPKAAMLTHHNLVNNARFIGDRMALTPADVLCCPPPLFHCFGLVLGLLAVVTHGSKIIYPAEVFDAGATLRAISDELCTAVHGVPAMFDSLFQAELPRGFQCDRLRTGIVAGAPVPRHLMELLVDRFGMTEFTSSYGLTEASPTCFNAFTDDSLDERLATVGTLMPHAHAKIVGPDGDTVALGVRGELCVAGYQLQVGYWDDPAQTGAAMLRDRAGVLWLRTGDEAVFDERGYCTITGRFKDIIIRGGENIYPLEIEERLAAHPRIARAVVVGLECRHYGEVVGAFLELAATGTATNTATNTNTATDTTTYPTDQEVREWVCDCLGGHKSPAHIFWLGKNGVPKNVPLTGSGKVKKFEMAKLGDELLRRQAATVAKM